MRVFTYQLISNVLLKKWRSMVIFDVISFLGRRVFKVDGLGYFVVTSRYEMGRVIREVELMRNRRGRRSKSGGVTDGRRVGKALQVLESLGLVQVVRSRSIIERVWCAYTGIKKPEKPLILDVTGLALLDMVASEIDSLVTAKKEKLYRKVGFSMCNTFLQLTYETSDLMVVMYELIKRYKDILENKIKPGLLQIGKMLWFYLQKRQKNRSDTTSNK